MSRASLNLPLNSSSEQSFRSAAKGKIFFDSDRAWNCLISNGFAYTLRHYHDNTPEEQFARVIRHSKDSGLRASKNLICAISDNEFGFLEGYVSRSGFSTVEEWLQEAVRLSGSSAKWQLFCVDLDEVSKVRARQEVLVEIF